MGGVTRSIMIEHKILVDQKISRGALKQDQAIKSNFWRSKFLIAVADGSTGHIVVTTPCCRSWLCLDL